MEILEFWQVCVSTVPIFFGPCEVLLGCGLRDLFSFNFEAIAIGPQIEEALYFTF